MCRLILRQNIWSKSVWIDRGGKYSGLPPSVSASSAKRGVSCGNVNFQLNFTLSNVRFAVPVCPDVHKYTFVNLVNRLTMNNTESIKFTQYICQSFYILYANSDDAGNGGAADADAWNPFDKNPRVLP